MTLKKALKITAACLLAVVLLAGVFSASAASDDPADSYVKQTAPCEDPGIDLWFDYSFRKNFTSDTTSTGMDTFSVYMAKNEIESAQFVLYSETDKTGMKAEVTDFTDGDGHTIPADIYYEMYVTTSDLNTQSVYGTNQIIREGETPDPILEMSRLGKNPTFKLNGGKSQAFLIRIKSAEDTPAGWYSAQLNIMDANGSVVKTATVYCHVWDFVISEETRFRSAFYVDTRSFQYGGNYQQAYDYLLENRLNAMDIPAMSDSYRAPRSDSPYITNPRVNSVRITSNGGGNSGSYMDYLGSASYLSIYEELSASPNWDVIKDKLYFYNVDEPLPYELVGDSRDTTDKVKSGYYMAKLGWPDDTRFLVTVCEDCAYYSPRENYYTKPLDQYPQEQLKDAYQEMIDTDTVQIWCAAMYNLTPYDELLRYGQPITDVVNYTQAVRSAVSNVYSGSYGTAGAAHWGAYDWNAMYGDPFNRFMSHIIRKNAEDDTRDNDLWMYSANENSCYTYTNHIIENTGLQTKLMCWQAYQCDVNGYLYFATNGYDGSNISTTTYLDKTVTGSKTGSWPITKIVRTVLDTATNTQQQKYHYGNGVLFYGKTNAKTTSEGVVGTLRVELLRDSVEEYQMLSMLGDLKGKDRAKEIVSRVSANVVRYLSLSGFDRSAWSSSMDEYDIMEAVRRDLGDELEAAVNETPCEHVWDNGTETKAATCKVMGEKLYTCTECGAERTEYIPTLHEVGDCFVLVSEIPTTCTTDGAKVFECTVCGFRKTEKEIAYHNDNIYHRAYESKGANGHSESCNVCGELLNTLIPHMMITRRQAATCEEDGWVRSMCRDCEYYTEISTTPAIGHDYVDGVCVNCGEPDPAIPTFTVGDIDGDGKINAKDINLLKQIVLGTLDKVPAADIDGDGKVSVSDVALLKSGILG